MATTRHVYSAYRFFVEMASVTEGLFSECGGLQVETEVFEWEEGGMNDHRHRLLGRTKYPNLVLRRGVASADLWQWYQQAIGGKIVRQSLSVVLYGYDGAPELRWNFVEAVPVKWVGPTLKSGSSEVAIETLELAHHGFVRA